MGPPSENRSFFVNTALQSGFKSSCAEYVDKRAGNQSNAIIHDDADYFILLHIARSRRYDLTIMTHRVILVLTHCVTKAG
jgi:uncharacterized protein YmfQ (DUF2313 family)